MNSKMSQNGALKKMVIKPFKQQPKLPDNYEESTWLKLATAVRAVNSKVAVAISKEELYRVRDC
jgi:cullin-4